MTALAPIVSTSTGSVQGEQLTDAVAIYRGIPYAAAPAGTLRFSAPLPHPGWEGVRDATAPGATPILRASDEGTIPEMAIAGEDYLNLTVTTSDLTGDAPVMVWIHGGSFVGGSVGGGWFDGIHHAESGLVHVAISYRLGFEGYGHIPGAPDNRALLDMIAALDWVRTNISAFGGDPKRVTVAGQSAGAGAALALLVSPGASRLFERMILHSPPRLDGTLDQAARVGEQMARLAGTEHTVAGWAQIDRDAVQQAQDEVIGSGLWSSVQDMYRIVTRSRPTTHFGPVFGTALLPYPLIEALERGGGADVPVLIGTTQQEFNPTTVPLESVLGSVTPTPVLQIAGVPPTLARAYPRAYPQGSAAWLLGQLMSDLIFRIPALDVAGAHQGPSWLWDFRWRPDGMYSRHCIDLPFAFGILDGPRAELVVGDDPPASLAAEFSSDLQKFISGMEPPWSPFTALSPVAKVYDDPSWVGRDPYRFERVAAELLAELRSE